MKWNNLCNFVRGHYEEQFCEFISNLGGGPFVQWREIIYALLKEGIMGNVHVKLYKKNMHQWFRRRCCLKIFLIWSSGGPFGSVEQNHLCKFSNIM